MLSSLPRLYAHRDKDDGDPVNGSNQLLVLDPHRGLSCFTLSGFPEVVKGGLDSSHPNDKLGKMTRDKRELGSDTSKKDDLHPENKRLKVPALARVIIEALQMDGLQRICSTLEPIIRRLVSEEVERALTKLGAVRNGERNRLIVY
ncbi:hypothetical protein OPV22_003279 [Ensete ventricosum]|uniref:Uncharacterized protein n=1 Tax=Ensete ventricosum TaxID=4639 RepID=A0AAV8S0I5_ENSVE|nr:hypothetical protein OPV22_003279 [Ensete ventricosum]